MDQIKHRPRLILTAALLLGCLPGQLQGQDDDLEYDYGLLATYRDSHGKEVSRIEETPVLNWRGRLPDARLSGNSFSARWEGYVLVRSAGAYRFFLHAQGTVRLEVNGEVLVDQTSAEPAWVTSDPVELDFGWQPLQIQFQKEGDSARLGLFWAGPTFQLEPLTRQHLFHDPDKAPHDRFEHGRQLLHGLRCQACHQVPGLPPALAAPSLLKVNGMLQADWIVRWLSNESAGHPGDRRMPAMGLDEKQAMDVAAYLLSRSEKPVPEDIPPLAEKDRLAARLAGKQQLLTTGCLACHQVDGLGSNGLFAGPELSDVGAKRPGSFFGSWLKSPEKLNPQHRMPRFELSDKERQALSVYLAGCRHERGLNEEVNELEVRDRVEQAATVETRVAAGKKLYERLRCDACHGKGGEDKFLTSGGELSASSRWNKGCLDKGDGDRVLPRYRLEEVDRQALEGFIRQVQPGPSHVPVSLRVAEHGCLACHARQGASGLGPLLPAVAEKHGELSSLLPAMVPPSLNSVGDKLTDKALRAAIARSDPVHRPWLKVRMPAFRFADGELDQLVQYLVDEDRIPVPTPTLPRLPDTHDDKLVTAAGSRLVTTDGFGCTSCHEVGGVKPPKAPLNAMGPDLTNLAERIRRPWYERWVRNPVRIVPRMEMPSVQLAVKGVLKDNLADQLDAAWYVLNKPGFRPPEPGALRIARQAGDGGLKQPAIVLSDVLFFNGVRYIKPLVVGLPNRHNVLFDLEANRLTDWWQGDAARQRTRGKSWLWEMTTPSWLQGKPAGSEVLLVHGDTRLEPVQRGQFASEVDGWEKIPGGLSFHQRLKFSAGDGDRWLHVEQRFEAFQANDDSGFRRHWKIRGLQPGETVRLAVFDPDQVQARVVEKGQAVLLTPDGLTRISIDGEFPARIQTAGFIDAGPGGDGLLQLVLVYSSRYPPDQFPVKLIKPDPPPPLALNVAPGIRVTRLPLADELMPTGLSWRSDGTLFVSSLKGRVWAARDTDGDGLEDQLTPFSDELAAPFGVVAHDDHVDVINKYALLRLYDLDGDGRAERTETVASGWGHTVDYHDWAVGIATDARGNYYIATPCQQDDRSLAAAHLRGHVIQLSPRDPTGDDPARYSVKSLTAGHRFPVGIAMNQQGDLFVTDNQGNYNPFNELNHVVAGRRYGFINKLERKPDFKPPLTAPAIDIPHPWTRSVNGICFLETPAALRAEGKKDHFGPWEGHLVGCEYDTRRLIRMSLQRVGETIQGAAYPLTLDKPAEGEPLLGPLACAISPSGDLYIGSIRDSGWGGANNIGTLVQMQIDPGQLPAGIAEVRAVAGGLEVQFTRAVDRQKAVDPGNYAISSYTRVSTPVYGGDDQQRRSEKPLAIEVSADSRRLLIKLAEWREGFVYELKIKKLVGADEVFFPAEAYYTLRKAPAQ
ncbi:MAG: c-type cytochrome [Planctomycetota bacterium]|nr:c-type cytochrome [Planctomycetota bacterium]